jgi:hypothetical protein
MGSPKQKSKLALFSAAFLCVVLSSPYARAEENGAQAVDCFGACPGFLLEPRLSARRLTTTGASANDLISNSVLGIDAAARIWRGKSLSLFFFMRQIMLP